MTRENIPDLDRDTLDYFIDTLSLSIDEAITVCCSHVARVTRADYIDIRMLDDEKRRLYIIGHKIHGRAATAGFCTDREQVNSIIRYRSTREGITGRAAETGVEQFVDIRDGNSTNRHYTPLRRTTQSAYCIPLRVRGRTVGTLLLESDTYEYFSSGVRAFKKSVHGPPLQKLTDVTAYVVERALAERHIAAQERRELNQHRVNLKILDADNMGAVIRDVCQIIPKALRGFDTSRVFMLDTSKSWFHCVGSTPPPSTAQLSTDELLERIKDQSNIAECAEDIFFLTNGIPSSAQGVISSVVDLQSPDYVPSITRSDRFRLIRSVTELGGRSCYCIDLKDQRSEEVMGCLSLYSSSGDTEWVKQQLKPARHLADYLAYCLTRLKRTLPAAAQHEARDLLFRFNRPQSLADEDGKPQLRVSKMDELINIIVDKTHAKTVVIVREQSDPGTTLLLPMIVGSRDVPSSVSDCIKASDYINAEFPEITLRYISVLLDPALCGSSVSDPLVKMCHDVGILRDNASQSLLAVPVIVSYGDERRRSDGVIILVDKIDEEPFTALDQSIVEAIAQPLGDLWSLESIEASHAATIRHDIAAKLAPAVGLIDLVAKTASGSDLEALQSAARMMETVHDHATTNKHLFSEPAEQEDENVDLQTEINSTVSLRVNEQGMHGRKISLRLLDEEQILIGKRRCKLITDALSSLVANAVKYATNGSDIEVKVKGLGRHKYEICVVNNGPYISQADFERVGEVGYRQSVLGQPAGTGLGVHSAKQAIEAAHCKFQPSREVVTPNQECCWTFSIILQISA